MAILRRLHCFGLLAIDFWLRLDKLRMDVRCHIGIDIGLQGYFRRFDDGFEERVIIFLKNERERYFKTGDTDIVLQHAALYQVFSRSRVAHMAQSINDLLWVHSFSRMIDTYLSLSQ